MAGHRAYQVGILHLAIKVAAECSPCQMAACHLADGTHFAPARCRIAPNDLTGDSAQSKYLLYEVIISLFGHKREKSAFPVNTLILLKDREGTVCQWHTCDHASLVLRLSGGIAQHPVLDVVGRERIEVGDAAAYQTLEYENVTLLLNYKRS